MPIRFRTLKNEYALSNSDLVSFTIFIYLYICICFIIIVIYCIFMIDINTPLMEIS